MMVDKRILIAAVAVVVAVAVAAVLLSGGGEDSEDERKVLSADVWFDDGNGNVEKHSGSGLSVKDIIADAIDDHDIRFSSNGNVSSVDGMGASYDGRWVVFGWSSPNGWSVLSSTSKGYDEGMRDGMSLALRYSESVKDPEGNITYEAPDIEVTYKVYYYVRIQEKGDATEWLRELPLTDEEKKEGFWIAGEGRTNNEALADAMIRMFYPDSEVEVRGGSSEDGNYIEYIIDGKEGFFSYGTKSEMYGWFLEFMGWTDTKVGSGGEYGTWTFWTQYSFNPDARSIDDADHWDFNQLSFGMYDISQYRYFGLVLKTSVAEDESVDLPAPSTIPAGL